MTRRGSDRRAPDTVVLVEGLSDRAALEALAARRGRDLGAEGVEIVAMGGASAIGHFLRRFGPGGQDLRLAGMCDAAEQRDFERGLASAGLGERLGHEAMEELGFFVCIADLEDELIRSLGIEAVTEVVDAQGDGRSFRTFCKQPAQQGRPIDRQLRRFMGTRSGRKIAYARLLVDALAPGQAPRPLDGVLAHV